MYGITEPNALPIVCTWWNILEEEMTYLMWVPLGVPFEESVSQAQGLGLLQAHTRYRDGGSPHLWRAAAAVFSRTAVPWDRCPWGYP